MLSNLISKLLRRFRRWKIRQYKDIPGWLTEDEAECLYRLARQVKGKGAIVEIGSWMGKSTYCLALGAPNATIMAIDPFDASGEDGSAQIYEQSRGEEDLLESFKKRMAALNVEGIVKPLKGLSSDHVGSVDSIDLLFIDGDHSIEGCRYDFESFSPKIVPGGLLLFHDFDPSRPSLGPTSVVQNEVARSGNFRAEGTVGSIWIGRKRAADGTL